MLSRIEYFYAFEYSGEIPRVAGGMPVDQIDDCQPRNLATVSITSKIELHAHVYAIADKVR